MAKIKLKNLNAKIIFPMVAILITLVGNLFILYFYLNYSGDAIQEIYRESYELNKTSNILENLQGEINESVLSYRFTLDPLILEKIEMKESEIKGIVAEMKKDYSSDKYSNERLLLENYEKGREGASEIRRELFGAIGGGNPNIIKTNFDKWTLKESSINSTLSDLSVYSSKKISNISDLVQSFIRKAFIVALAEILFVFLLTFLSFEYITKSVTDPIVKLSRMAEKISQGEFVSGPKMDTNDEIGFLSASLDRMSRKLKSYYEKLEQEVKDKNSEIAKAKELEDRKNEFISMASHELKTPITSLKLFTDIMYQMSDKNGHKMYEYYIYKIRDQANKLTHLVNDLLDLSKIQAGKISYSFEPMDLDECVRDVVSDYRGISNGHRIEVFGVLQKQVNGDRERMSQVIANLLSNAVKYSPEADRVFVEMKESGSNALVCVEDFGIGVGEDEKEKIFNRFYRAGGSSEKTFPGMGIGLFVSSEIIKAHQGKIYVESEKGKGSKFCFTIPLLNA